MSNQVPFLDFPNEILLDHILSYVTNGDLFCNVGLVCQRLMDLTFDVWKQNMLPFWGLDDDESNTEEFLIDAKLKYYHCFNDQTRMKIFHPSCNSGYCII